MPDLVKLLIVLLIVLVLLSRRWNLGAVLLLATALLGVLFGRPLGDLAYDVGEAIADPMTLRLAAVVVLIMALGGLLRETAGLDRMVEGLEGLVRDARLILAVWPAFIGLLPMVGGAIFSAPLVDQLGQRLEIVPERRTFVNYWFRHIWEYVFPLYPSFLLGTALLGVTERQATAALWPLFVASVLAGVLLGLIGIRREGKGGQFEGGQSLALLFRGGWPVALVLVLALGLRVDLVVGLVGTLVLVVALHRVERRTLKEVLWHVRWSTLLVVFGAMAFRRVLESTGAVASLSATLARIGVPSWAGLFAIPFASGLLTGLGTGAFGVGFPIVLPLLSRNPPGPGELAWVWSGGFLGVMLSPMHLCLALTREYFEARWGGIYRRLVPAVLIVAATAAGMLFFGG